jgi:hypothetical protein
MPPGHGDVPDVPDVPGFLSEVRADVTGSHPARVQRDDPVVEAFQPSLALAHDLRV